MAGSGTQRYDLAVGGHEHRVEVEGTVSRTIRWYVDGELVATATSAEDKPVLEAEPARDEAVGLAFGVLGHPQRVTLFQANGDVPARARAVLGTGGIDLDPEPGSPAARREARIREHPWRHAAVATAGGVAKVVVPLLLGLLVVRLALALPWPEWDVPWPDIDLPSVPWPDVPWPDIDLPSWEPPGWVRWLADKLGYVWPILLAFFLARGEIRRRRKQDALKARLKAEAQAGADRSPAPEATDRTAGTPDPRPDEERRTGEP